MTTFSFRSGRALIKRWVGLSRYRLEHFLKSCRYSLSALLSKMALWVHPLKTGRQGLNVKRELAHMESEEIARQRVSKNFVVATLNVTGDLNLSMIIRFAEAMGAREFHVLGRRRIDHRAMVGVNHYFPVHREDRTIVVRDGMIKGIKDNIEPIYDADALRNFLESHRLYPVYIEQPYDLDAATTVRELSDYQWDDIPDGLTMCLIFGNETRGIPTSLIREVPGTVVYISQPGVTRSLNVSTSAILAVYEASKRF